MSQEEHLVVLQLVFEALFSEFNLALHAIKSKITNLQSHNEIRKVLVEKIKSDESNQVFII